jgi:hypothetical protein
MAIKTFTTGEVLTAADTNAYLGNGGLVFVKQQTVSGNPTSMTVTDAFSATYDNYRITVTGMVPTVQDSFRLMIGSGRTNGHYGVMNYDSSGGGATATLRTVNAASNYCILNQSNVNNSQFTCDILSPFLATRTTIIGAGFGRLFYCDFAGGDDSLSSYTSFTLLTDGAATLSGGTITVHGYRKS